MWLGACTYPHLEDLGKNKYIPKSRYIFIFSPSAQNNGFPTLRQSNNKNWGSFAFMNPSQPF
jgi:hypothetical protein